VGLSLSTTKADLIRAIMEGAAYGLRHNLETAGEDGYFTRQLSCVGGGSKSAVWNQIKADVLNMPISLPKASVGAPLGDAILAAVATGLFRNLEQAQLKFVQPGKTYQPNTALVKLYDEFYHVYLGLYPALRDTFRNLGMIDESPLISARGQEFSNTGNWRGE
jgi:xylulokinase